MPSHSALLGHLYRLTCPPLSDAELLRRWVERRDEDAFTTLVSRHGRMVHGVCRRVLGNRHDAEDAYQVVFLLLARKAAAIRHPEALAGWLHGVAVRLALKARAAASRRRTDKADASASEPCDPHPDPLDALGARELMTLIDREIARLPEVYRLPVVLCDLEERTQAEAARLLGWTLGSLRGRLLRGRERLRTRLAKRGIAPALLTAALVQGPAEAALLTANISRLAVRFAVCPTSAEISPAVAALVREGIGGLLLTKLKIASAVLLATRTLVAGAGLLAWPNPATRPPQAEERRDNTPPAAPPKAKPHVRRDQAGDPLPAEAISRLGTLRFRHSGFIESLAFGPDGKSLVSCGGDGIRFWDSANGKEIHRFPEQSRAFSIALSPDGKQLAIRVRNDKPTDPSIAIREYATGRLLRRFGDRKTPSQLLFSPDGKVLAAQEWWGHDIELWDPAGGRRLHKLKGHKDHVRCIAFSGDSKRLVSGSDDNTIRFWDVATGKESRQIQHHQGIGKIALSPDGKFLASIDIIKHVDELGNGYWENGNRVRLWDTATGKELRQFAMPAKESDLHPNLIKGFRSLDFAPDGKTLLAGGEDGILRIWDPQTGRELRQFPGFAVCPSLFAFAPDRKRLAVVDGLSTIRVLDLASGRDRVSVGGHRSRVLSIGVTPDGQTIATIGQDNTLCFWEPATGRELRRRAAIVDYSRCSGLRADGRTYVTVGPDKLYRLHDLASGEERAVLRGHKSPFRFALAPDGKTLASVNAGKEVRLLDPATGAVRHTLTKVEHWVTGMSFSADGRTLVVWDADRNMTVWDAATGKKRRQFRVPTEIGTHSGFPPIASVAYSAALSPDGKLIAFGLQVFDPKAKHGILPVLDTTTGKEVCRFTKSKWGAGGMVFSPDSKSLAWPDGVARVIYVGEIATGRERHRFAGHTGIQSLAFSADGKMLISGSEDTTALVWDLTGRLAMGKKYGKALSAEELQTHWKTLAADDAAASYRAVQMLAADPARSVPYLRTRLHPVATADEKRLKHLIADLDSNQFVVREKAASELEKLGAAALHALRKALAEKPTLETRRRLEQLIEKQEREEWSRSAENLRSRRALEVLERAGTVEAKDVLMTLANGAPGAWQTRDAKAALRRLSQRPGGKR